MKATLISKWFNLKLVLYVKKKVTITDIAEDYDRYYDGLKLKHISRYQIKKVINFFGKDDHNFFDRIEY